MRILHHTDLTSFYKPHAFPWIRRQLVSDRDNRDKLQDKLFYFSSPRTNWNCRGLNRYSRDSNSILASSKLLPPPSLFSPCFARPTFLHSARLPQDVASRSPRKERTLLRAFGSNAERSKFRDSTLPLKNKRKPRARSSIKPESERRCISLILRRVRRSLRRVFPMNIFPN